MEESKIIEYFTEVKNQLLNENNRVIFILQRNQCNDMNSGVYCFFIDDKVRYIGETGCLKKRINDLLNTKNHTFRRSLGELYFSNHALYLKATSTKSYDNVIETLLIEKMQKHLKFSFVPMKIGRKEFEEWFQDNHSGFEFLNKRKKRK